MYGISCDIIPEGHTFKHTEGNKVSERDLRLDLVINTPEAYTFKYTNGKTFSDRDLRNDLVIDIYWRVVIPEEIEVDCRPLETFVL